MASVKENVPHDGCNSNRTRHYSAIPLSDKESEDEELTRLLPTPFNQESTSYPSYGCSQSIEEEGHNRYASRNLYPNAKDEGYRNDISSSPLHDRMRRKIRYYFMNPVEKWRYKGKFPWKLGLQVLKIIFVTLQLSVFGSDRAKFEQQKLDAATTFRHIFLDGWDSIREVVAYPPATGPYAVYTVSEFYDSLDHVVKKYSNITFSTIGSYGYNNTNGTLSPLVFCKTYFKKGKVFAFNSTLMFDNTQKKTCVEVPPLYPAGDKQWLNFSFKDFLESLNETINFDSLINVKLSFILKTVFLKSLTKSDLPDCYVFHISIIYDNSQHDGQILVSLNTASKKLVCQSDVEYAEYDKLYYLLRQLLNGVIILFSCLSLMLCCRSVYRAQLLCKQTVAFFKKHFQKSLGFSDQMEFLDLWYVMIIVNDVLIVTGSALKIQIELKAIDGDQYSTCAILLGVGNLLAWAGVLRYLGYFHKYNIIVLTLKRALPNVLRFMFCALLLYGGFCFCGWVVLGPYHIKFRSLSSTSECLFAMMNGDDLFATFAIVNTSSSLIWWFSRAYLYLFISLFIYVVISLFISVIMDSYETIKEFYVRGFPQSDLQVFISEVDDSSFTHYQSDNRFKKFLSKLTWCNCFSKRREYTSL